MSPALRSPHKAHTCGYQSSNTSDVPATHMQVWKYLPDGKGSELRGVRGDGQSRLEGFLEEEEHKCILRGGRMGSRPLWQPFFPHPSLRRKRCALSHCLPVFWLAERRL